MCKNAIAPMIAILSYLKTDIEVSDTGMETMEPNNCKGISRKNKNINGVLAMIQEGARFSHKDR